MVWVGMALYVGVHFFSALHIGFSNCLPSDFPHYPRATLASIVVSDSLGDCTMQFQTRDSATEVQTFFETNLNQGDWTVTAVDDKTGLIRFQRSSRPGTVGYVRVLAFPGQPTQFQVQIRAR